MNTHTALDDYPEPDPGVPLPDRLNWALLEKTVAHIEAHPDQFDSCRWWETDLTPYAAETTSQMHGRPISCGTVGCIAGWAAELAGVNSREADVLDVARRALGLTMHEACALFSPIATASRTGINCNREPHRIREVVEQVLEIRLD